MSEQGSPNLSQQMVARQNADQVSAVPLPIFELLIEPMKCQSKDWLGGHRECTAISTPALLVIALLHDVWAAGRGHLGIDLSTCTS